MLEGIIIIILLQRLLFIAIRHHPQGINYVREKVKQAFFLNSNLCDEIKIKQAIAKGRYEVREIVALSKFHKYRTLKKRYDQK